MYKVTNSVGETNHLTEIYTQSAHSQNGTMLNPETILNKGRREGTPKHLLKFKQACCEEQFRVLPERAQKCANSPGSICKNEASTT